VRFDQAIDAYLRDQRAYGRINSDRTEDTYRSRLQALADDTGNRDPRTIGRDEIKATLRRWKHPNTQRVAHAVYTAFFDWTMEEGLRPANPARQVRKAKKRPSEIYRLSRTEVVALMDACATTREQRLIHLGVLAGLRNQELRGLRGEHLARPGAVWVSADIAKGRRERWVPVLAELEPIVAEIQAHVAAGEYVMPSRRPLNPPANTQWRENPRKPSSAQAVWRLVGDVARRAGIHAHVHPHLLRHAFGDHVARHSGLRAAQELLGHASVDTTQQTYTSRPTLDELTVSVHGLTYRGYPPGTDAANPQKATTGIEPVDCAFDDGIGDSR
jgi:integrase/recombinase XerC